MHARVDTVMYVLLIRSSYRVQCVQLVYRQMLHTNTLSLFFSNDYRALAFTQSVFVLCFCLILYHSFTLCSFFSVILSFSVFLLFLSFSVTRCFFFSVDYQFLCSFSIFILHFQFSLSFFYFLPFFSFSFMFFYFLPDFTFFLHILLQNIFIEFFSK